MRTPRSTVARLGVILAAALAAAPSEAQTTFTLVHSLAPGVVNPLWVS